MQIRPPELSNGNNPLHNVIAEINFETLNTFCNRFNTQIEKEALYRMALTPNNEGRLPIDLIVDHHDYTLKGKEKEAYNETKRQIINTLEVIMCGQPVKPLKEKIDFQETCEAFSISPNTKIHAMLKDACLAMNTVREKIVYSATHLNGPKDTSRLQESRALLSQESFTTEWKIKRDQLELRLGDYLEHFFPNQKGAKYRFITDHTSYFAVAFFLPNSSCNDLLTHYSYSMNNHGLGNCGDMAFATLYHFNQLQLKKPLSERFDIEIVGSRKGDHVFNIVGRDRSIPINDYQSWQSPNVLLIDTWTGASFPGTRENIERHLRFYSSVSYSRWESVKCMPFYNPHYHDLSLRAWDCQPQNLHIVYLAKEEANEYVWRNALEEFKHSNGNYHSPQHILSSTIWEHPDVTCLHYPQNKFEGTIEEQLAQFENYFFELYVDKPGQEKKVRDVAPKKYISPSTNITPTNLESASPLKSTEVKIDPAVPTLKSAPTILEKSKEINPPTPSLTSTPLFPEKNKEMQMKDKCLEKVTQYVSKREVENTRAKKGDWWAYFRNLNRLNGTVKVAAGNKLIQFLKGQNDITFSQLDIDAIIEPGSELRNTISNYLEIMPKSIQIAAKNFLSCHHIDPININMDRAQSNLTQVLK